MWSHGRGATVRCRVSAKVVWGTAFGLVLRGRGDHDTGLTGQVDSRIPYWEKAEIAFPQIRPTLGIWVHELARWRKAMLEICTYRE